MSGGTKQDRGIIDLGERLVRAFCNGVTYGGIGAAAGLPFYPCASRVLFGAELNAALSRPVTNTSP